MGIFEFIYFSKSKSRYDLKYDHIQNEYAIRLIYLIWILDLDEF